MMDVCRRRIAFLFYLPHVAWRTHINPQPVGFNKTTFPKGTGLPLCVFNARRSRQDLARVPMPRAARGCVARQVLPYTFTPPLPRALKSAWWRTKNKIVVSAFCTNCGRKIILTCSPCPGPLKHANDELAPHFLALGAEGRGRERCVGQYWPQARRGSARSRWARAPVEDGQPHPVQCSAVRCSAGRGDQQWRI